MANLKTRNKTLTSGGWQAYKGPCEIVALVMDGTSLSSNVLTLYDTAEGDTRGIANPVPKTVATLTQDTDFGTTVPVRPFRDGSVVATLATESADTHTGLPFFDGIFINKTGDTTHTAAITLVIKPLIRKSVDFGGSAAQTVNLFTGPGILKAVEVTNSQQNVTLNTGDILLKDGNHASLRTIVTATNLVSKGPVTFYPVTTTGIDDAGSATTTAATGAYANDGVVFREGLWIVTAQQLTTAGVKSASVRVLIDA